MILVVEENAKLKLALAFPMGTPITLVKRSAIITCEHVIYKLPHELPNDLRLRILGN